MFDWSSTSSETAEERFQREITEWIDENTEKTQLYVCVPQWETKTCNMGYEHTKEVFKHELKPIKELWNYVLIPTSEYDEKTKVKVTIDEFDLTSKIVKK